MQNTRLYKKSRKSPSAMTFSARNSLQLHATSRNFTQLHATLRKTGFSLIEVAIAIAVLLLVLGGVTAVFVGGVKAGRKTQQQTVAYNLARATLEQYSNWLTLDQLDSGTCASNNTTANNIYSPTNQPSCSSLSFNTTALNNITYTPRLAISDGPINATYVKVLNATINWSDGSSPRTISVSTLKARY